MIIVTRCHENHDGNAGFHCSTVMIIVTSLFYHTQEGLRHDAA